MNFKKCCINCLFSCCNENITPLPTSSVTQPSIPIPILSPQPTPIPTPPPPPPSLSKPKTKKICEKCGQLKHLPIINQKKCFACDSFTIYGTDLASSVFNLMQNENLKCDQCKNLLNEYDQPKCLPCGKTICSMCEIKIKYIDNQFKCDLCSYYHDKEFNLPINQSLYSLVTAPPIKIQRSQEYNTLNRYYGKIEGILFYLKNFENGAIHVSDKNFEEQARIIDLEANEKIFKIESLIKENESNEQVVKNLNEKYLKILNSNSELIDEIKDFKKEFNVYQSNKFLPIKERLIELIETSETHLTKIKNYLNQNQTDDKQIEIYNEESYKLSERLEDAQTKLYDELLTLDINNNMLKYYKKSDQIDDNLGFVTCFKNILIATGYRMPNDPNRKIKLFDLESNEFAAQILNLSSKVSFIRKINSHQFISGHENGLVQKWNIFSGQLFRSSSSTRLHSEEITGILVISNDKCVTCSKDKSIILFELRNFDLVKKFIGHNMPVLGVDTISESKIISCSADTTIRLWDLNSGECLKIIQDFTGLNKMQQPISCIKVLTDEIIIYSSDLIKIFNIKNDSCLNAFEENEVTCIVKLSNELIASSSFNGQIKVWNVNTGECLIAIEESANYLVRLSMNKIVSCSTDKTIKIFNTLTGECLKIIQNDMETVKCADLL